MTYFEAAECYAVRRVSCGMPPLENINKLCYLLEKYSINIRMFCDYFQIFIYNFF